MALLKLARVTPQRHPELSPIPWPIRKTAGSAGMDLCADIEETGYDLQCGERRVLPTGVRMEIPEGYEGQIRPRSGLAINHGVTVINAPGTIDSDFRGEVMVGLVNHGQLAVHIGRADRIAQLVVSPVVSIEVLQVDEGELSSTVRGANGFGSTGRNDTGAKK